MARRKFRKFREKNGFSPIKKKRHEQGGVEINLMKFVRVKFEKNIFKAVFEAKMRVFHVFSRFQLSNDHQTGSTRKQGKRRYTSTGLGFFLPKMPNRKWIRLFCRPQ